MVSLGLLEQLMKTKPKVYQTSITALMSVTNMILDMNLRSIKSAEDTSDLYYRFYQPWTLIKLLSIVIGKKPHSSIKTHHLNMKFSILFEFISMCIKTSSGLALSCIGKILQSEHACDILPDFLPKIVNILKNEKSIQVRRIAFNICYSICDRLTVEEIVPEMIHFVACCPFLEQQDPVRFLVA
ncbi:hypothetical protein MXB_5342 [Myxobolus squamalis]|nr:hypothetical protein MXB_5342 [Myxobolus squamalis]